MDDTAKVFGIFGAHPRRSNAGGRLHIRDGDVIADLKARISDLAARDNGARDAGWLIDVSPTRIDDLTERSMFDATLTSERHGERRLAVTVARDWIEIGGGAMESAVRNDPRNLQAALENAFRRVVSHRPSPTMDPAEATRVSL